jgi:hypothetical protein
MYLRTAAAGRVRRSLVLAETASERSAQPSDAEYRVYVCTNASLSSDIFTMSPRSAKLRSFVPLLILIANKGPPETAGPFSCVVRPCAGGGSPPAGNRSASPALPSCPASPNPPSPPVLGRTRLRAQFTRLRPSYLLTDRQPVARIGVPNT